jgi:RNA polymerase sigma-70 factor (ECF subfamily)
MPPERADATAALVLRAREGDRGAYDRLFERAAPRALQFVRLRLGPRLRGRVEEMDVLQDAYLDAHAAFPRFHFQGPGSFSRWLCRIIENRIRGLADFHGAEKRRPRGGEERISRVVERVCASTPGPSTEADRNDRHARLASALAALPEEQREVLLLRFFQDRSVDEIAHLTGQSPSSVRRLAGRATARLGRLLSEGGRRSP